jgi:hypothetical protein
MPTILLLAAALVAAPVAILVLLALRRPAAFRVQRSIHIAAPPDRIEPLVSDLRRFMTWNPFADKGPLQLTYSGPERGAGAACDFAGSRSAGRGRLAVIDATPGKVTMLLTMSAPIRCENTIDFLLEPGIGGTGVTWAMIGRSPFIARLMGLLFDTDCMVGRELERGLAALRTQAEAASAAKAA